VTIRNPKDSTNASCNIVDGGNRKTKMPKRNYHHNPRKKMEKRDEPSSDRVLGDLILAVIASFMLLVVAVAIYIVLENVIDNGGRIE